MRSWENLYNCAESYTLEDVAAQSDYVTRWSTLNDSYYFSAPFSGMVAPAAHNFVINFMSNYSAENPGGFLSRDVLKSFFAVTGEGPGSFVHNRGKERIPDNWYERPLANAYNISEVLADDQVPGIVRIGRNTVTTNSFAGVDLQDLTSGAFNAADFANGNKGACFLLQASLACLPDISNPLLSFC
ncbi:Unspecific peroxygenase [Ascochyta rabiei]|uniref:Peroxidase n=1 Tax=Didymella rabiei TaxID=5454 RepID=A0A163LFL4_DIDRA|nr:Unspecific peroxygenase [Ascochyta rabiei]KZM27759.1 peroxidase [Ascochyta rabiei]UPX15274.1 Unspecific peroxygenase [Ascochyta rabiei]